ncbi:MAG: hypothetical protein ACYCSS_04605 [Sulfuriferula sp.]
MNTEIKRYFIYVHFRDSSKARLVESAKALQLVMKAYFNDNYKMVLASQDAIGFLVTTSIHPHGINAALVSPDREKVPVNSGPLLADDELLVLEIGEGFSARNLGSAQGWLSTN